MIGARAREYAIVAFISGSGDMKTINPKNYEKSQTHYIGGARYFIGGSSTVESAAEDAEDGCCWNPITIAINNSDNRGLFSMRNKESLW